MSRIAFALLVSPLLAGTALAQTPATATVRVGCTLPAPEDSFQAKVIEPTTWLPGAGDLIVMEAETLNPVGNWVFNNTLTGFAGDGYFRYNGPDLFTTPGVDILSFRFQVETPGTYIVRIHNRHDDPNPGMQNDCWIRMDGGPWSKFFENSGPAGVGIWTFNGIDEATGIKPRYTLTTGTHNFQISARSYNFKIDRVHAMPPTTFGESKSFPESRLRRYRPEIGEEFVMRVGDPTDSVGFTPNVAQTYVFGNPPHANYPCGQTSQKFGEFLIALSPKAMSAGPPKPWKGPKPGGQHTLVIPNDPMLVGFAISLQGFILETGKSTVTDALDIVVGDV